MTKLKETAGDFDATKAEAAIATYTRVSNMHIDTAKLAASTGDNEKAASEIKKAVEVWPKALNRARTLEERRDRQVGSALSWYLKARSRYPNSELANQGIDRLVGKILPGEDEREEAPEEDSLYLSDENNPYIDRLASSRGR